MSDSQTKNEWKEGRSAGTQSNHCHRRIRLSLLILSHTTAYLLFHGTDSRMRFDIIGHPLKFERVVPLISTVELSPPTYPTLWPKAVASSYRQINAHACVVRQEIFPSSYSHIRIFRPRCRAYTPDFQVATQFYVLRSLYGRAKF